jgi:hypothetical protein
MASCRLARTWPGAAQASSPAARPASGCRHPAAGEFPAELASWDRVQTPRGWLVVMPGGAALTWQAFQRAAGEDLSGWDLAGPRLRCGPRAR